MQAQMHTERTLLPRGLIGRRRRVYTAEFSFKLDSFVDFHGERAVVVDRSRSAMGRQLYTIIILTAAPRRLLVLGKSLKHFH